jgi:hypothetical protein
VRIRFLIWHFDDSFVGIRLSDFTHEEKEHGAKRSGGSGWSGTNFDLKNYFSTFNNSKKPNNLANLKNNSSNNSRNNRTNDPSSVIVISSQREKESIDVDGRDYSIEIDEGIQLSHKRKRSDRNSDEISAGCEENMNYDMNTRLAGDRDLDIGDDALIDYDSEFDMLQEGPLTQPWDPSEESENLDECQDAKFECDRNNDEREEEIIGANSRRKLALSSPEYILIQSQMPEPCKKELETKSRLQKSPLDSGIIDLDSYEGSTESKRGSNERKGSFSTSSESNNWNNSHGHGSSNLKKLKSDQKSMYNFFPIKLS